MEKSFHESQVEENLPPKEYWQVVLSERKSAYEHELARPNLIKVLLLLPFSNAGVEIVFSQLKLIKTDHMSSLKQESLLAYYQQKCS